jgi:hypothetical protein
VLSAIRTHESPSGSSLAYLKKHLKAEYEFDNATVLLKVRDHASLIHHLHSSLPAPPPP